MNTDFTHTTFGNTGLRVHRLGLSASYWPGKKAVYKALDEGLNLFFCYGFDRQMISVLRDLPKSQRENYVIVTGAYNLLIGHPNLRRTLEKRLRQLRTDYIDAFLFLGVTKEKHFTEHVKEELCRFSEEGKVRTIGISTHDRKLAGRLVQEGILSAIMIRYNAAHRGAEEDIFPHLYHYNPGVISYTATRWRHLLRRPRGWAKNAPLPTPGICYRFVLSNPHVDVCLTAPSNIKQLQENLASLQQGPLSEEEMVFMRQFGDTVHQAKKWFM
ncbi:MAG: aldo/keto reductase [candidate division Zixibacteria bacterium]|nr:aldo/keto reductase [candidate division Zixibacteria bacterium]